MLFARASVETALIPPPKPAEFFVMVLLWMPTLLPLPVATAPPA
jgi:hypothetical protein